jgi:hypothetical protein
MKKLLNNPWFVGLLAAAAIVFVTHAALKDRGVDYASGDETDDYEDVFADESDLDDDSIGTATNGTSVWEALDALTPSSPPDNPFDDNRAEIIVDSESEDASSRLVSVHLSAIWSQGVQTLLLVNDRIHAAGDTVVELEAGDLTIESASLDGIWLSHPAGRDFLSLGKIFTWNPSGSSGDPNPTLALHEN